MQQSNLVGTFLLLLKVISNNFGHGTFSLPAAKMHVAMLYDMHRRKRLFPNGGRLVMS